MEFSAKDATILSLLWAHPDTRLFADLIEKLDAPQSKELARKIRERASENASARDSQGVAIG